LKNILVILFISWSSFDGAAQENISVNKNSVTYDSSLSLQHETGSKNRSRLYLISGIHVVGYAGTLYTLGQAWYKDHPKTSFHTFNDSKEWLQMDKAGHVWTSYNIAKYTTGMWRWAGVPHKKAIWLGGASSMGYQTILEFLDAYSSDWGWSWSDVGANAIGAGAFIVQEAVWNDQRIQIKFSSHKTNYDNSLTPRANELYGKSLAARVLKDYNSQTYWLSFNINSFLHNQNFPSWLNVAVGYGATGMFGGFENTAYSNDGEVTFFRPDIKRYRQWYLSPDIDWTRIKTNKKGVRTMLSIINMIKVPAPSLELTNGKLRGKLLYF